MERIGTEYGGWILPTNITLNENSIIYSAGVGEDISFDLLLQNKYNCKIFLIDPTKRSIKHYNEIINFYKNNEPFTGNIQKDYLDTIKHLNFNENKFIYINKALWDIKTELKFYKQTNENYVSQSVIKDMFGKKYDIVDTITIKDLMKQNNHNNIDLLKLDIEGAEINVLNNLLNCKIYPKYILVEFDLLIKNKDNFNETKLLIDRLLYENYKIFANDKLNITFIRNI